jgi:uncharacterized membrane protein
LRWRQQPSSGVATPTNDSVTPLWLARPPLFIVGDMYTFLVFVHVISAMLWLGGGMYALLLSQRSLASGNDATVGPYLESVEKVNGLFFAMTPPITLLAGIGLVFWSDAWRFSQAWVYLALGLAVVVAAVGGGLEGGAAKNAKAIFDQNGAASPEFVEAVKKLHSFGWVDVAVLTAIVVLMVFKPGV